MQVQRWSLFAALVLVPLEAGAGYQLQGYQLQGADLEGYATNGKKEVLVTFPYAGLRKGDARIVNLRIEKGELVGQLRRRVRAGERATLRRVILRGADFKGVTLQGRLDTGGQLGLTLPFRIAAAVPEDDRYEPDTLPPGARGGTWRYALQVRDPKQGWRPACRADADGKRVAIPVAAIWDRSGQRRQSSTLFTLSCTTGVIAKCYRWGYRPWYVASQRDPNLWRRLHWSCTRMARADYCGDGFSRTREGTPIYEWDNLQPPVAPPLPGVPTTMIFESGWSTCGAVCLSRFRWQNWPAICPPSNSCLYRRVQAASGQVVVPNVCDTPAEAARQKDPQGRLLRLFNLSNRNIAGPE